MSWEDELFALLDDLEGQASALYAADRDVEVADRTRGEYAAVTLASRLHASVGRVLALHVDGVGRVEGTLARVGSGWCLVEGRGQEWIVCLAAVTAVEGASDRSVPDVALSPVTRLGIGTALRRLADAGERCVVRGRDGTVHDVVVRRVGADFVEVATGERRTLILAVDAIAAVQRRED